MKNKGKLLKNIISITGSILLLALIVTELVAANIFSTSYEAGHTMQIKKSTRHIPCLGNLCCYHYHDRSIGIEITS